MLLLYQIYGIGHLKSLKWSIMNETLKKPEVLSPRQGDYLHRVAAVSLDRGGYLSISQVCQSRRLCRIFGRGFTTGGMRLRMERLTWRI